jgi:hypothetical protein
MPTSSSRCRPLDTEATSRPAPLINLCFDKLVFAWPV